MRPKSAILFFVIFLAAFSTVAQENWNSLHNWIGRYPTDGKKNFFKLPAIQNRLKNLLSKEDLKHLTDDLSIETPIENISGYLVVKISREHCSPCDNAMLALDLKNGAMYVGFYKHESHRQVIRWFYSQPQDKSDDLPKEIREEFLYMHEPKV